MTKCAIDTNVLVYLLDLNDSKKHKISKEILVNVPIISTQVVVEFLYVAKRILSKPKDEVLLKCREWLSFGEIITLDMNTLEIAIRLIQKYDFQLFDSIIVASALEAGCVTLYTEDMQHGLVVEKKLKIVNPFL